MEVGCAGGGGWGEGGLTARKSVRVRCSGRKWALKSAWEYCDVGLIFCEYILIFKCNSKTNMLPPFERSKQK